MSYEDNQLLPVLDHAEEQDRRVREDIKNAVESYDKDFFAQVVQRVLDRLNQVVTDFKSFVDNAFEWFRNKYGL